MAEDEGEVVVSFREKGVYRAIFTAAIYDKVTEAATQETNPVIKWVFTESDESKLDTLTGREFTPRSKATKIYTGILGRPIKSGDKPSDQYGTMVDCVYGENQAGRLTVTEVLPLKDK